MDDKTKKTWISVLIAGVIIIVVLAIAIVGGTAFFFYRHIDARFTGQEAADQTFERTRARFSGQQPLIEVRGDDEPVVDREHLGPAREVHALHALVYSENTGKLTHVDVPGWLIRLMSAGGHIRIANLDVLDGDERTRLTLDDLERHGPGLVLDLARRHGSQVLIWTE